MTFSYSVWQWSSANGWAFFFGSNSRPAADQVAHALKLYDPQHYFGVYGTWTVRQPHPIRGERGTTRYYWGEADGLVHGWMIVHALSKILAWNVRVFSDSAVAADMPYIVRNDLRARARGGIVA